MKKCFVCGKPCHHAIGDKYYCCEHSLEITGTAADWHTWKNGCMDIKYNQGKEGLTNEIRAKTAAPSPAVQA
jgi:hypothetical protein